MENPSLSNYEEILNDAAKGKGSSTNDELNEYYSLCLKTAELVRARILKYKEETEKAIETYGW